MTRFLDRLLEWPNDVLAAELQLAVLVCPSFKVLAERAASDGHIVSVDQVVLQEVCQNLCHGVTC